MTLNKNKAALSDRCNTGTTGPNGSAHLLTQQLERCTFWESFDGYRWVAVAGVKPLGQFSSVHPLWSFQRTLVFLFCVKFLVCGQCLDMHWCLLQWRNIYLGSQLTVIIILSASKIPAKDIYSKIPVQMEEYWNKNKKFISFSRARATVLKNW